MEVAGRRERSTITDQKAIVFPPPQTNTPCFRRHGSAGEIPLDAHAVLLVMHDQQAVGLVDLHSGDAEVWMPPHEFARDPQHLRGEKAGSGRIVFLEVSHSSFESESVIVSVPWLLYGRCQRASITPVLVSKTAMAPVTPMIVRA